MTLNNSTGLYVATGSHRYPVREWSDEGVPMIAGTHGLIEPPFDEWTLEDEGVVPKANPHTPIEDIDAGALAACRRRARLRLAGWLGPQPGVSWSEREALTARAAFLAECYGADIEDVRDLILVDPSAALTRIETAERWVRELELRSRAWPELP